MEQGASQLSQDIESLQAKLAMEKKLYSSPQGGATIGNREHNRGPGVAEIKLPCISNPKPPIHKFMLLTVFLNNKITNY